MIITDESILRKPCENAELSDVGSIIDQLDRDLIDSAKKGYPGIGLAGPQINIHKKVCIVRINDEYRVDLVNARIEKGYDKAIFNHEGCLSFPDRYEKTMRYQEIVVKNDVPPYNFIATGLFAVVIQHEIDHLNSILLPDVALPELNQTIKRKIRPNDVCLCGSGKKFKKCCQRKSK